MLFGQLMFNIFLTFVCCMLFGSFSPLSITSGFIVSAILLFFFRRRDGLFYLQQVFNCLILFFVFIYNLIKANIQVLIQVLSPKVKVRPGIIAIPMELESDMAIATLANMITLTPGTLSIEISRDNKILYVHCLDCTNPEAIKKDIYKSFHDRIKKVGL